MEQNGIDINVERIINRLNKLGSISDNDTCLSRYYGTKAHKISSDLLISWMQSAGMKVTKDTIGNVRGVLKSKNENAKHFVIGSHYDTVFNAGKYDGPLGILLGLEVAQKINEEKIELPFHLNIIAFADEEGSRFNTAYLGSSVLVGKFDKIWLNRKDDTGQTLAEVIEKNNGKTPQIFQEYIPNNQWLGYFEVHIEQGPVLCTENLPLALVDSISSQTRINIIWEGVCGHAGTYPMDLRADALCAASEFILEIEKIGIAHKTNLVATVGKLTVEPNTSNVIPGTVAHSLDIRSPNDLFLSEIIKTLKKKATNIADKRGITLNWEIMQENPSVLCNEDLKTALSKSILASGVNRIIEIPSGAGHDAVMISKAAPVAMLFVRCKAGISHNPLEYTSPSDIKEALKVCNHFINEIVILENLKNN